MMWPDQNVTLSEVSVRWNKTVFAAMWQAKHTSESGAIATLYWMKHWWNLLLFDCRLLHGISLSNVICIRLLLLRLCVAQTRDQWRVVLGSFEDQIRTSLRNCDHLRRRLDCTLRLDANLGKWSYGVLLISVYPVLRECIGEIFRRWTVTEFGLLVVSLWKVLIH